jgi:hypothetical protein
MSQYRSDVRTPSHDELTQVWSVVVKAYDDDMGLLVFPDEMGLASIALPEEGPDTLGGTIVEVVSRASDEGFIDRPCPWLAFVAPAFIDDSRERKPRNTLRQEYLDGNEDIRQVLVVISIKVEEGPTGSVYSQPLLETIHEEGPLSANDITMGMFAALASLNV